MNTDLKKEKWRNYMRERRKKIKAGLLTPTPMSERTISKMKHYQRDYQRKARQEVLGHYGNRCACCGESEVQFLSVDHIDGGGRAHRKKIGVSNIATWLIRNDFPPGFQILCHNCNMAKGLYGKCPHVLKQLTQ